MPQLRRWPPGHRGSTLLLFPAAVLIMVALAAMAIDSSIAFLAQRELANATAAAANDAATRAVSDASFYQYNRIELSPDAVAAVAVERVHSLVDADRHHDLSVEAEVEPPAAPGCGWTVRCAPRRRSTSCSAGRCRAGPDGPASRPGRPPSPVGGPAYAENT